MKLFSSLSISATGLSAERIRMETISSNIKEHAREVIRTEEGGPYIPKVAVFKEAFDKEVGRDMQNLAGVEVAEIVNDSTPLKRIFDPTHPDADEEGFVLMPNVEILNEMADLIVATRSYEANVTALNASKGMYLKALEIGR